ncbi:MAG: ATP-binding protein [Thermoplasmatota archaeon]
MDSITAEEIISEWHERKIPGLIKREINFELPETGNAVAVIGPRRAGKSFFFYDIIYNRLDVDLEDTLLVNLEDHRFGIPDKKDLDNILTTYYGMYPEKDGKRAYIFFDEVQNVEGWEGYVRSIMDRFNAIVFISGSSSKLLSREIATSMRGRSISYLVMPFSFREFLSIKNIQVSRSPKGRSLMLQRLKEYLRYGGFPDVVLEKEEMIKRKLLRGYVEVMLFRDVVERYEVKHVKVLKLLMKQMMASTANSLSMNKFYGFLKSQGIKIDKNTLYQYKDHLVDAFGFIELKRINGSFRTIEQGKPKIYPIDTGYMTDYGQDLDNNMGRYMETCVAVELRRRIEEEPGQKIHFWRENSEIDFVISDEERVKTLIQVCFDIEDDTTLQREINGLIDGSKDLGCEDLLLLNWDREYEVTVEGKVIRVMPLWSWSIEYQ